MNTYKLKYLIPIAIIAIILFSIIHFSIKRYQASQAWSKQVADRLDLDEDFVFEDVRNVIPNYFEIGWSRDEVLQKVVEIDPSIDLSDSLRVEHVCNRSGECSDYIEFFEAYGLTTRFSYDEDGKLVEVGYSSS